MICLNINLELEEHLSKMTVIRHLPSSVPEKLLFVNVVFRKNRFYRESDYQYDTALFAFEYGLALRV